MTPPSGSSGSKLDLVLTVYLREMRNWTAADDPTAAPISTNAIAEQAGLTSSSIWRVVGRDTSGEDPVKGTLRLLRLAHSRSWDLLWDFVQRRAVCQYGADATETLLEQLSAPIAEIQQSHAEGDEPCLGDALCLLALVERRPGMLVGDTADAKRGSAVLDEVESRVALRRAWLALLEGVREELQAERSPESLLHSITVTFALLVLERLRDDRARTEGELQAAFRMSLEDASKPGDAGAADGAKGGPTLSLG